MQQSGTPIGTPYVEKRVSAFLFNDYHVKRKTQKQNLHRYKF